MGIRDLAAREQEASEAPGDRRERDVVHGDGVLLPHMADVSETDVRPRVAATPVKVAGQ